MGSIGVGNRLGRQKMQSTAISTTLAALQQSLAQRGIRCEIHGDPQLPIRGIATLEDAQPGELSFLSNPRYERQLEATSASAVVLRPGAAAPDHLGLIRVQDPYAAITVLLIELYGYRNHRVSPAFRNGAPQVAASARLGRNATLYPGVTIDDDVIIGDNVTLYPGCFVGRGSRLGDDVVLYPNVVIYDGTVIGNRVTIHAGTVIGNDGLGYAPVNGQWVKIPQIGTVEIGDDVEIGSNCSIDRATLGRTRIGSGTKLSNLIAIGHGTEIGEHCMLVAQVGLAGSVKLGRQVTLAGQVGVAGHLKIGDRARIGAKAGVVNDVPEGADMLGQPAIPINEMKRQVVYMQRLPQLFDELKQIQRQLAELMSRTQA